MGIGHSKNNMAFLNKVLSDNYNNNKSKFYLTHGSGNSMLVVVSKKPKVIELYDTIFISEKKIPKKLFEDLNKLVKPGTMKTGSKYILVGDYRGYNQQLKIVVAFAKPKKKILYETIRVGYDVNERNINLQPSFGIGNTILISTKDKVQLLYGESVIDIDARPSDVTGFVSPIDNNDTPVPLILLKKHVLVDGNNIVSYNKLPKHNLKQLLSYKNPSKIHKDNAVFISAAMGYQ